MKLLLISLIAFASTSAFAEKSGRASLSNGNGYGMAGCGLGSMAFKENDKTQILAATTNGLFGTQTFGITFGTSNCGDNGKLVSKEQVQQYIAVNQNALKNDIARGNGESLNGLAEIMGANNNELFASQMKANYSKIFVKTDLTAQQITDNLYSLMN